MSEKLYDRLGGKAGVDKLVDRVLDHHLRNEAIAPRFRSLDESAFARSREKAKEFFAAGSGGPEAYTGRSMPEAHAGMNVSAAEFLAAVDDIMKAMNELGYPRSVRDEVLGIAYSLKEEIVHR